MEQGLLSGIPWEEAVEGFEFVVGDQYLVAVAVSVDRRRLAPSGCPDWRWEYSVVVFDEDGNVKLSGGEYWGWDWSDVRWYINAERFKPPGE